jgi:hypothetical protein
MIIKLGYISMGFAGIAAMWAICRKTIMVTPDFMLYLATLGFRNDLYDLAAPIIEFFK